MFPIKIEKINEEYADKETLNEEKGYSSDHYSLIFYNNYNEEYSPEDIKDVSRQIDHLIESCDFFKNRNKKLVDTFKNILISLNNIVIDALGSIYAEVDLLGDEAHIEIFSKKMIIKKEFLPMFSYAVSNSESIFFSRGSLDFHYSFEEDRNS